MKTPQLDPRDFEWFKDRSDGVIASGVIRGVSGDSARIVNGSVVFEPRFPLVLERLARSILFQLSIPKNTTPRLRKAAQ